MESDPTARNGKGPIRVLVVAPTPPIIGGQTVQAARLFEGLNGEPWIRADLQSINPLFFPVLQKIKYVRTMVTSIRYLADLISRIPYYDIIHVFSASYFSFLLAPTPAVLVSKLFRKRTILNYHSGEARDHFLRWRRTAIPTVKLFDSVVTPSAYLVNVFKEFGVVARPIFNIVDPDRFRFRERSPLRPLFLSNRNFEPHYNVSCTLRAFSRIQRALPEAQLVVAGDGPEKAKLKSLARELELQKIEFIGRVSPDEMPSIYDKADVFLNSPSVDNMPLSIIEAFACGLPVVSTNVGGIPYIVENGKTGLLVEDDDYCGLADAAISLFETNGCGARLAAAARKEVARYSWKNVRKEWQRIYCELVSDET